MDPSTAQHNQQLYDSVAGAQDSSSAIKARAEGEGFQLKQFHNAIKRALIMKFCFRKERLLDVGCGRGGDISKWIDAKIGYVKGLDLSPGSIKEAEDRLRFYMTDKKTNAPKSNVRLVAEFAVNGDLGSKEFKDTLPYDCITSMFTLHYFFESEASLKQLLHNVSENLKPGGIFFGCVPDGKRVLEALRTKAEYSSQFLRITREFEGAHKPFGSAYRCAIGDTVTNGDEGAGSLEFLVFRTPLEALAARVGLKPILDFTLEGKNGTSFFDDSDKVALFKHFAPKFTGADPSLAQASQLFCAFAFQKVGDSSGESQSQSQPSQPQPSAVPHVNKKRRLPTAEPPENSTENAS